MGPGMAHFPLRPLSFSLHPIIPRTYAELLPPAGASQSSPLVTKLCHEALHLELRFCAGIPWGWCENSDSASSGLAKGTGHRESAVLTCSPMTAVLLNDKAGNAQCPGSRTEPQITEAEGASASLGNIFASSFSSPPHALSCIFNPATPNEPLVVSLHTSFCRVSFLPGRFFPAHFTWLRHLLENLF